MTITADTIVDLAKVIGALVTIWGVVTAVSKWLQRPKEIGEEIADLHKTHSEDIKSIQDELCVLSYAMLASLDGLKQLNCNGEVTKAHRALEKHINKKAHDLSEQ